MVLKRLRKNKKYKNSYFKNNLPQEAIKVINDYQQTKVEMQSVKCLCGVNSKDEIVAEIDRYGFDITTKLCLNCGLMRSDPYYVEQELNNFYNYVFSKVYANEDYEAFFKISYWRGQKAYAFIDNYLNLSKNKLTIYEIGCGSGGCLKHFAENNHTVMGCDLGDESVSYGKNQGLNIINGSIEDLIDHGQADLLISSHSLEHFTNPMKALNNMKALLKPNGYLYIQVPGVLSINIRYSNDTLTYLQNAHAFHFTLETLSQIASREKFKMIDGTQYVEALFQLDDSIAPIPYDNRYALTVKNYLLKTEKIFLSKNRSTLKSKIIKSLKSFFKKFLSPKMVNNLNTLKSKIIQYIYNRRNKQ